MWRDAHVGYGVGVGGSKFTPSPPHLFLLPLPLLQRVCRAADAVVSLGCLLALRMLDEICGGGRRSFTLFISKYGMQNEHL